MQWDLTSIHGWPLSQYLEPLPSLHGSVSPGFLFHSRNQRWFWYLQEDCTITASTWPSQSAHQAEPPVIVQLNTIPVSQVLPDPGHHLCSSPVAQREEEWKHTHTHTTMTMMMTTPQSQETHRSRGGDTKLSITWFRRAGARHHSVRRSGLPAVMIYLDRKKKSGGAKFVLTVQLTDIYRILKVSFKYCATMNNEHLFKFCILLFYVHGVCPYMCLCTACVQCSQRPGHVIRSIPQTKRYRRG